MGVIHITHLIMGSYDLSIESAEPDLSFGPKNFPVGGHKAPKIDENHRNIKKMSFFGLMIPRKKYLFWL